MFTNNLNNAIRSFLGEIVMAYVLPPKVKNKWKDKQGKWKTNDLFYEPSSTLTKSKIVPEINNWSFDERLAHDVPLFYFSDFDVEIETANGVIAKFYSLKKIYLSYLHAPGEEYEFAVEQLGGWEHWQSLQNKTFLKGHIANWRKEYAIMTKCKAARKIIGLALSDEYTKDTFQASKFLVAKGWEIGENKKQNARIQEEIDDAVEEDLGRIGLRVVK